MRLSAANRALRHSPTLPLSRPLTATQTILLISPDNSQALPMEILSILNVIDLGQELLLDAV